MQIEKTILIEPMGEFGLCVELFCINSRQGEIKKGIKELAAILSPLVARRGIEPLLPG